MRHRAPRRANIPEPGEDAILVDGVGQLCADLGIEPTDVVMLVLAWHFQAVRMCEFTRVQFVDGLTKLGYGRRPPPPGPPPAKTGRVFHSARTLTRPRPATLSVSP